MMEARMKNVAEILPDAVTAIQSLIKVAHKTNVPHRTLELVHLRASQINGCSPCVYAGAHSAKKNGETDERIWAVAAWRDAPFYTDDERAALALAEAMTRLSDRPDAVPDDVWDEVVTHFDEEGRAALILWIATTNLFNRINATTRQPAGQTWG